MTPPMRSIFLPLAALTLSASAAPDLIKTASGTLEGTGVQRSGVREFKGIPFAQPPVGALRWTAPQPVAAWDGVRQAKEFGPRCMQQPIFGDMGFRSNGMSEDCLYLNIWTPGEIGQRKASGDGLFLRRRIPGRRRIRASLRRREHGDKGIVAVTVNYRLGVFGFLAHPELTKESPHHASGNYALLDQNAALQWVHQNIAAFGGDPGRVTIAGESAGSIAVSAQMASPLSKDLIAGAIGESGSILGALAPVSLAKGEEEGVKFATVVGKPDIASLRAIGGDQILEIAGKRGGPRFSPVIDGYFFPEWPAAIFSRREAGARSAAGRLELGRVECACRAGTG